MPEMVLEKICVFYQEPPLGSRQNYILDGMPVHREPSCTHTSTHSFVYAYLLALCGYKCYTSTSSVSYC